MDTNIRVIEMEYNQELEGFYLLKDPIVKTASSGRPFFSAKLVDATGSVSAKFWDYIGELGAEDNGRVVKVRGTITEYKGELQLNLHKLRLAKEGDVYELRDLVPVAPIDAAQTYAQVKKTVASMEDEDYKRICEAMLERHEADFVNMPAGKSMHHSFLNGLLMHTAWMLKLAEFLSGMYAPLVDRDLLLAGTLLHDFGKMQELERSEAGLVTSYSVKGQLLGHLVMGAEEVAAVARELAVPEMKSVLLQHMLISHHGTPEFGAAVLPCCVEAELLSYMDLIDSRMEIYRENLEPLQPGEFTGRVFALDKKLFRHK